ncbi:PH, RCC1 and FYVE domains-containing protein 1-like isoform X2 [Diospyros lotus]|uniref:PH, RCC1 and FYVE domains-containing protein 1-like isoform X2 n=1 Tax=Diospyros lotus TaxID=55363 RepID=UPI00225BC744|nr:PH, RCC1 and FYVE domains-containing protein 1-like isoform X2 [Diospyros lotus]
MADSQRAGLVERDIEQAIKALKKGAYLLKYGRRGKPKFSLFRLSTDETALIWYRGKEERRVELCQVSRIIPGQRTATFQRYPRPEKEYQSFSLICNDRSLDLICKDKDELEVWFVGLKALIAHGSYRNLGSEARNGSTSADSPHAQKTCPTAFPFDQGDTPYIVSLPHTGLGKAFSDIISLTAASEIQAQPEPVTDSFSPLSCEGLENNSNGLSSVAETFRVSLSSGQSLSSHGSTHEDFDASGDVLIWGEQIGDGLLGGGMNGAGSSSGTKTDAFFPKLLESTAVLDVHRIACGGRHAVLVTKQGEIFSWGEESGGRLGHGVEADVSHPKFIDALGGVNIELVSCGEYHTCAVSFSGDLYTWGDGSHNSGLLGHGSEASHWIPKKVSGILEGIHVSYISCGPWHTALVTSAGQLFTFGDGTFGALGHGDHKSAGTPREVEALKGLRTVSVACGVWHTAAVIEVMSGSISVTSDNSSSGMLFTWGNGDKGQLGHGDRESSVVPKCVVSLINISFCQVACGHNLTVALTTTGRVYTMGSTAYGQLGSPLADAMTPTCVEGNIASSFVEEIACGSYHVAVLTSKREVYTWGKGAQGQLGHGDSEDRNTPTLIDAFKDKQIKSIACGANFTAVVCLHGLASTTDDSLCSGCHNPFNFRRKHHNCYNCGLAFCSTCSSRKSLKASLAPSMHRPYRVCDDCFNKLNKVAESGSHALISNMKSGSILNKSNEAAEKEIRGHTLQQSSILASSNIINQAEGRNSRSNTKIESNGSHVFPIASGNTQRGSISSSKASKFLIGAQKNFFPVSVSVPVSRMVSRAPSPVRRKSAQVQSATLASSLDLHTSEMVIADSKNENERLRQDVLNLRAQVEDLTSKSQLLEAELGRMSRQLKEATDTSANEAEKFKAAKEVIKSLTAQVGPGDNRWLWNLSNYRYFLVSFLSVTTVD